MALGKMADSAWEDLIRQAAAEILAANPTIAAEQRELSEEEYAQVLADDAEIERIWQEMDRHRGNAPRRYTTLDALNEDRGAY